MNIMDLSTMAVEHILKSEHDSWGKPSLLIDDSPRFFLYPVCTRAPDISHEFPARRYLKVSLRMKPLQSDLDSTVQCGILRLSPDKTSN